jgi:anaerobic ribonucleoside-triphosphate reductase activating protein
MRIEPFGAEQWVNDLSLRIHLLRYPIYALGPGKRICLWVQGCSIHCDGCISRETWDFDGGTPETVAELIAEVTKVFKDGSFDGLTISGGEPFDQPMPMMNFLWEIKAAGIRDVLIYSGYKIENIVSRFEEIKNLTAAIVDGSFESGNDTELCWKGSANQSLTLFRSEYAERYAKWEGEKKGRLQVLNDARGFFIAGIPRQGDIPKILSLKK